MPNPSKPRSQRRRCSSFSYPAMAKKINEIAEVESDEAPQPEKQPADGSENSGFEVNPARHGQDHMSPAHRMGHRSARHRTNDARIAARHERRHRRRSAPSSQQATDVHLRLMRKSPTREAAVPTNNRVSLSTANTPCPGPVLRLYRHSSMI